MSFVTMEMNSQEFPLYITVELVDWRNERWVWRERCTRRVAACHSEGECEFRSPRNEKLDRNVLVTAESQDGRRVPIVSNCSSK